MKHYNHFGEILKEWRQANNMSQKDIANNFYSISTISRIEKHGKIPQDENFIIHLSKVFNLPVDYISRLVSNPNHFLMSDIENEICDLIRMNDFKGAKYKLYRYIKDYNCDKLNDLFYLIDISDKLSFREFETKIQYYHNNPKPITKYKYWLFYLLFRHYLFFNKDINYLRMFFKTHCKDNFTVDTDVLTHRHFIEYILFKKYDKNKLLSELKSTRYLFHYGIVLCLNNEFDKATKLFESLDHKLGLREVLFLKEYLK